MGLVVILERELVVVLVLRPDISQETILLMLVVILLSL